ncbi:MAG: energy transducer TonB [Cephaloticoccus sp.]|nr:energy transducer TonB [Cephaloticoccus sp.]MCF7761997.1 energy transducer TonB [Cephaloticoccus sp.]
MKTVHKLVIIVGLLLAPGAFASSALEQAYIKAYRGRTGIPVPLAVVSPELPAQYAGQRVMVEMVINKSGIPGSIKVKETKDVVLENKLIEAMTQWRFAPALRDGEPVETTVVVPIHIEDGLYATRYATY